MKILITGGNTAVHIDKVRVITNIFKGKTACDIAADALESNHYVVLVGNPHMQDYFHEHCPAIPDKFICYKTYDELYSIMGKEITSGTYDAVIHSAAVSDYKVGGVIADNAVLDNNKKISSNYKRLYLELIPTEKIVDKIRDPWGFKGKLVKFKLQVEISDEELIEIAKKSRITSGADIIVANCLEWAKKKAYIITENNCMSVERNSLAYELMKILEKT